MAYSKTRASTSTIIQNPTHDKIEKLAEELSSGYIRNLLYATGDNAVTIIDYDTAMKAEASSYSPNYRRSIIGGISKLTKYLNDKRYGYGAIPSINRDVVVAGSNWTEDVDNTEYSCKYCRRTMPKTKIIDSSHQNPSFSLYCSFCGILSEIEEDTRKKSKVKVHKGKITEPAVSYAPELTLKRKTVEYKGGTKVLSQKGSIRITGYNEGKG